MIVKKVPNPKKSASKAQRIGQLTSYVRSPESESPQEKCLYAGARGFMAHLVSVLEHIAATTGAAVLYLHHVNKGSARDGQTDQQQAARGASALIDNARWCGYVAKMTEQEAERLSDRGFDRAPIGNERRGLFVRFGVSKQNYDATPLDRWYQRHTGGVLLPVELQEIKRESGNKGGKGYDSAAY